MRYSTALITLLPAFAAAQSQTGSAAPQSTGSTHWVSVGEDGLTFTPDSLDAAVGDEVVFSFFPSNHAVVRSTFDKPCAPMPSNMDGAVYSGFPDTSNGESDEVFTMWVNDTKPIWLYCPPHCSKEMVMVINPEKNSDSTLDAYKQASANASPAEPANEDPPVVGGTLSSKDAASETWSGSGAAPTQTDGAMGHVRPEWFGIAAGVGMAAYLI
ncbi:hypothetical protein FQN54_002895 [Arachnomyces sp. PD_36]|nr:hypothetical protein FQN54_002895 [Arachnomyces sp. PD_36]